MQDSSQNPPRTDRAPGNDETLSLDGEGGEGGEPKRGKKKHKAGARVLLRAPPRRPRRRTLSSSYAAHKWDPQRTIKVAAD